MAFQDAYLAFLKRLPGIAGPIKRMTFRDKLKWTGMILLIYFAMSQITAYGADTARIQSLGLFELLLGAKFGSLMTLGIGPIVTASIILQLMVGSKIIPWDLTTEKGKMLFQGSQKFLGIIFSIIEGAVFVLMGAVPASAPGLVGILIAQLAMGGILVIFMDELISKWGFGSGIGLFIVAGVSSQIITSAINPFATNCPLGARLCFPTIDNPPVGMIPQFMFFIGTGEILQAFFALMPVIATVVVFLLVIYANAIKIEIPLAFGSIRGFGRRWPLKFFYTSNIPVILVAALLANVQLMGRMLSNRGMAWIGTFDANGQVTGGLVYFITPPRTEAIAGLLIFIGIFALIGALLAYFSKRKGWKLALGFAFLGGVLWYMLMPAIGLASLTFISLTDVTRLITYSMFMIGGAVIFSVFWVTTAGMSAKSVAEQIQSTGMQIPGYRRDIRIIERVLNRYIPALAVLGGAAVGFLAAYADFTNALGTGTGILLATMIIYQLYEELATQHMEDMHPAIRKLLGK